MKFMEKEEYKTFGKSRSVRLKGIDYTCMRYPIHIIISTKGKKQIFRNNDYAKVVGDELSKLRCAVTWCIMYDHVHILLCPEGDCIDVLNIIRCLKGRTSAKLYKEFGLSGVWQKSFYDHILRRDEDIETISLYILNNPVRKKIVDNWYDYDNSWSKYYER